MDVDILIDEPRWNDLDLEGLTQTALPATFAHLDVPADAVELSILACDDARIAELNGTYRDKAKATNVLSWPAADLASEKAGDAPFPPQPDPDGSVPLGDIAIAYETCMREAGELDKPTKEHVTHLIVHGVLHLLGYDHIRDPDATLMQAIETEILGKLGYDDPYNDG